MDLSQGSREDLASCLPAGDVQFTGMATRWCGDCAHGVHWGRERAVEGNPGPTDVQLSGFFTWGLNTGKRADVEGSQGS